MPKFHLERAQEAIQYKGEAKADFESQITDLGSQGARVPCLIHEGYYKSESQYS